MLWPLTALAVLLHSNPGIAQPAAESTLPRLAVEDRLSADAADVLVSPAGLPVAVAARLILDHAVVRPDLEARLAAYAARHRPVWLAVAAPASLDDVEAWQAGLRQVLEKAGEAAVVLEILLHQQDEQLAGFVLRLAATEARAANESIHVAVGGTATGRGEWRSALYTPELAPYIDLLSLPAGSDTAEAEAHLAKTDPTAALVLTGLQAADGRQAAVRQMVDSQLQSVGTGVVMHAWRPTRELAPALQGLASIAPLMTGDITELDARVAGLRLTMGERDVTEAVRHRLLFNNATFATYLICWVEADLVSPLGIGLTLPVEGVPAIYRLADGTRVTALDYSRNPENGQVRVSVPPAGGPLLVDFNEGADAVYVQRSDVSAERRLSVEEIIARHQQQQRAQDALVRNYIATAMMQQHFRPTMTDPGYDVVTENRYYVADDGIEWEELSFSVNGSRWGPDRPPFPLLQPEKVLSLPLQLRFGSDYTYRLAGTERVGNFDCYVVRFEPLAKRDSLYRGTVWIERRTFARVKVQAVQTGLSAPVVSNEEIQTYVPIVVNNQPVFLFAAQTARQIMMIAGRNLLVEKSVSFDKFQVNAAGFEQAREEARRSDRVMYRETDRGLRYFVKEGEKRIVSERATRTARAMAMGVTLDPSYAFPLPIFGINYLNFEFGGPDSQLAVLFAGVLAAGNLQRPRLGSTPFDGSVDFFAIAVPSSDRVYDAAGEREGERVLTWPLTAGANAGWQYTAFQKLTGHYHLRFDGYVRDRTTADEFGVPASALTNGVGVSWEYRRGGYSALVNGTWFARAGWREWGRPDGNAAGSSRSAYAKYSASLSRDFYFNVFQKVRLNAAWFGGQDLDRFAKYQFGMFDDTRIHGVPASGVRFEELGMVRGAYSFNVFEQYRLDVFLEQAWGRDRAFDAAWQPITGIGAAVNLRAPWNTILRADVGRSFLPDRYRNVGSTTVQIMFLKPLR